MFVNLGSSERQNQALSLTSKNDHLVREFCADEDYCIKPTGEIFSRRNRQGHLSNQWREVGHDDVISGMVYRRVKYKKKSLSIHRIIWHRFGGELDPLLVINHIDGNPSNNHIKNLEQVTRAENNLHSYRVNKRASVAGNAKLTPAMVQQIRTLKANGYSLNRLARELGLAKSTISYIVNGRTWKDVEPQDHKPNLHITGSQQL